MVYFAIPEMSFVDGVLPPRLRGVLTLSRWSAIVSGVRSATYSADATICCCECMVCIFLGFPCIFCCHPCFRTSILPTRRRQAMVEVNRLCFENHPVIEVSETGIVFIHVEAIPAHLIPVEAIYSRTNDLVGPYRNMDPADTVAQVMPVNPFILRSMYQPDIIEGSSVSTSPLPSSPYTRTGLSPGSYSQSNLTQGLRSQHSVDSFYTAPSQHAAEGTTLNCPSYHNEFKENQTGVLDTSARNTEGKEEGSHFRDSEKIARLGGSSALE